MTIVASNSLTVSNVNDGTITHSAYSWSSDGTDRFTTVYPNLNLLDGTKDFSGDWVSWGITDGTYKGLTVKKRTSLWAGIYKKYTVNTNSDYTFSAFVKGYGTGTNIVRTVFVNGVEILSTKKTWTSAFDWERDSITILAKDIKVGDEIFVRYEISVLGTNSAVWTAGHKWEQGSIVTPYMPSANEATTADWPSYIGQYSDFTSTASTDPTKYAPWTVFKGNDGRGIVSSEQKYKLTQTSAKPVDPWDDSVWQTTQPTTTATNKYLWSITRTTFNLAPLTQDIVEQKAVYGDKGNDGSKGDPGKVVSDTEPTTRFKGLTWKYSGTADLTASDGTVIKPNTEYYFNGKNWMINFLSANNLEANSITADLIDAKNLTITDGAFVSTTTNGLVTTSTEIKDNHIAISKTDGTVKTRNDIALDSEQGLAQKFTNIDTGFYRTAGINYQGPFTSDSVGNYAQLTPQGTKLSTDVPWTKLSLMNNFTGNIEYAIINGTVYISASGVGVPAMTAGQWNQAAQLPTGSSAIPIRANRITAGDSGDGLSWALLSNQAGGLFIRCSANKAATANLFNATLAYPIG